MEENHFKLLKFELEDAIFKTNLNASIVGCDEVGRGCIAGPIVGGAVTWDYWFIKKAIEKLDSFTLPSENVATVRKNLIKKLAKKFKEDNSYYDLYMLLQIDDSKRLTSAKRKILSAYIKDKSAGWGIFEITAKEIDKNGVGEANRKVLEAACLNSSSISKKSQPTHILVDHFNIFQSQPEIQVHAITKGDQKSLSIAAASIVAKVHRDDLMHKYHEQYPNYGFNSNVGYGTPANIVGIKLHGFCPLHRRSFTLNLK